MDSPIRTDALFHYTLSPAFDPTAVFQVGLRPLSLVDPAAAEAAHGIRRELYLLFAAPVLGPHADRHSGIFLTPIDFHQIRDNGPSVSWIKRFGRFQVPVGDLEPHMSVLTWAGPFPRASIALSPMGLGEVARLWSSEMIVEWFGRDRSRMFFHVPQVVTYQDMIPVAADQWQPAGQWR